MTVAIVQTEYNGATSAFLGSKLVMNFDNPVVACCLRVKQLENSITTLEQLLPGVEACHQSSLVELLIVLKVVHQRHIEEHNEIVTAAPTAEDQMAYLVAYAAAIGDVA